MSWPMCCSTDGQERRLGTFTFPIERSKLRELAHALGDEDPVWHDRAVALTAGFDGVPTPPTVTTLAAHWIDGGLIGPPLGLGLDPARLLHGESAWTYERPVRLGDELTAVMALAEVAERVGARGGSMSLLTVETRFHNQEGVLVATLRDTWIETNP